MGAIRLGNPERMVMEILGLKDTSEERIFIRSNVPSNMGD
jgi:hypothetical protein